MADFPCSARLSDWVFAIMVLRPPTVVQSANLFLPLTSLGFYFKQVNTYISLDCIIHIMSSKWLLTVHLKLFFMWPFRWRCAMISVQWHFRAPSTSTQVLLAEKMADCTLRAVMSFKRESILSLYELFCERDKTGSWWTYQMQVL